LSAPGKAIDYQSQSLSSVIASRIQDDCKANNFLLPIIAQWDSFLEVNFMHGGTPYFVLPVCVWLDNHFPGWQIGHQGPTVWPP
jgi:hypothetical protein